MISWTILLLLLAGAGLAHDVLRQLAVHLAWSVTAPFAAGDAVRIDEHSGIVEKLGWLNVRLRDADGDQLVIPNSRVMLATVVKTGAGRGSQPVELRLPVPGEVEPGTARRAALMATMASPYLALDREIHVTLERNAAGATAVRLRAGVFDGSHRDDFSNSVIEGIHEALSAPQQ
jgi:small-conductance mechanosensitive channel